VYDDLIQKLINLIAKFEATKSNQAAINIEELQGGVISDNVIDTDRTGISVKRSKNIIIARNIIRGRPSQQTPLVKVLKLILPLLEQQPKKKGILRNVLEKTLEQLPKIRSYPLVPEAENLLKDVWNQVLVPQIHLYRKFSK